ncbi:hypothetical protein QW180_26325 [Vibrio sinaloensis]|nr:hypothetical protein [Vibrio sinaloensis]
MLKKMSKIDNEVSSYKEEIRRLTSEVYDLTTEADNFKQGLTHIVTTVDSDVQQILAMDDLPEIARVGVEKVRESSNQAKKVLKVPVIVPSPQDLDWPQYKEPPMDFDDDIPF